jgi:hypothetical protein
MKFSRCLTVLAVAALPQFAQAGTSVPVNAAALGALESVLNFCSHVDEKDEKRFEKLDESYLEGTNDRSVQQTRQSGDYKSAYQTLQSVLKDFAAFDALQACSGIH